MKNIKNSLKIGGLTIGAAWLILVYNFLNMYSLVGKCPDDTSVKPCRAYDNWVTLNEIGLIILAIGVVLVVIDLLKRHQNKP